MDRLTVMEIFVRVVETGSFSTAARSMGVVQPTVSKAIAALEQRLSVRLLLRSTRGLAPTSAGDAFYQYAKRIVSDVETAEHFAYREGAHLTGRIRINADVTFARLHIFPAIGRFLDKHPQLSLDVILGDRNLDPLEDGADVALRIGSLVNSGLIARKLGQARRLVVGAPGYFDVSGIPTIPTQLTSHDFIVSSHSGDSRVWTFRKADEEMSLSLSGRLSVNAAEGVREAVLARAGLAVVSEWTFMRELQSGLVRPVLEDWHLPPCELWAVMPAGRMASAKARAFIEFVQDTLGLPNATNTPENIRSLKT
ncbi:LysR family transcriptional regulator [Cupriavidus sp. IDO]|uniref:LysR family transcriptional regulator n=1 Tax=Cupriavidus sp. IDO TaxID=1539142 RepID=UPI0005797F1F|nr:LysR family transcriptional regulator [Cupriavidus sp. IDO]KWR90621.1 transcriptional regulator [Cupriavidus sp. IDO]